MDSKYESLLNIAENSMAKAEIIHYEQFSLLSHDFEFCLLWMRQHVSICGKGLIYYNDCLQVICSA